MARARRRELEPVNAEVVLGSEAGAHCTVRCTEATLEVELEPGQSALRFSREGALALVDIVLDWAQPHRADLLEKHKQIALWGVGEIADNYGVSKAAVRKWLGHEAFPKHRARVGGQLVWEAPAVRRWVRLYRRGRGRPVVRASSAAA